MNLRLDSKSIRVRVSLEEVKILAEGGKIQESLPFPPGYLFLELNETNQEKLSLDSTGKQWLLNVPKSDLRNLMLSIESVKPASKQALEVRETIYFESVPIELRFEIDCLTTRKNKKEKSHD